MRAGDTVKHRPTGETWLVAGVEHDGGHLYACGWPCTRAEVSDCTLVKSCSDAEHIELLKEVAEMRNGDPRKSLARWRLGQLEADG